MNRTDIRAEAYKTRFYLMRARRYYAFFATRWSLLMIAEKIISVCFFVYGVIAAFVEQPQYVSASVAFIGAFGIFLDLVFNAQKRMAVNYEKEHAFANLVADMNPRDDDVTQEELTKISKRRIELERNEIVFPCVSAYMHNEIISSKTGEPDYKLSVLENTIGMWLPIKYRTKPLLRVKNQLGGM